LAIPTPPPRQLHGVRGPPFLTAENAHQPSRATAALLLPLWPMTEHQTRRQVTGPTLAPGPRWSARTGPARGVEEPHPNGPAQPALRPAQVRQLLLPRHLRL